MNEPRLTRREVGIAALACGLASHAPGKAAKSPGSSPFDCRGDFPILSRQIDGRPFVYLDNAATTQRPNVVIDAIADFYRTHNANPAGALHELARESLDLYEHARASAAEFLNANEAGEIVFTRGTTEAINLVASSWGRANLREGDEILLTVAEHASNLLPWRAIARERGAVLRF